MEVQQSLQEIASLLFMLHDYYFNNLETAENILMSLWRFIEDVKLDHKLCILDVEEIRQIAMSQPQTSKDQVYMGYEQFYNWLSGVGMFLRAPFQDYFKKNDMESVRKQALHYILTKYVIPSMSQWEKVPGPPGSPQETRLSQRRKSLPQPERILVTKSVLEVLTTYREFLLLWFRDLIYQKLSKENRENRGSCYDTRSIWEEIVIIDDDYFAKEAAIVKSDASVMSHRSGRVANHSPTILWRDLSVELLQIPIIRSCVSADDLESLFLLSASSQSVSSVSSSDSSVTFLSFLYFLELLSDRLPSDLLLREELPELHYGLSSPISVPTPLLTTEMKLLLLFKHIIKAKLLRRFQFLFEEKPSSALEGPALSSDQWNQELLDYYEIYHEIMTILRQSKLQLLLFSQPNGSSIVSSGLASPEPEENRHNWRSLEDNWEIFHQLIECFLQVFFAGGESEAKGSDVPGDPQADFLHPSHIAYALVRAIQEFLLVGSLPLSLQRIVYTIYRPLDELQSSEFDPLANQDGIFRPGQAEFLQQHHDKYLSFFQLAFWAPSLLFFPPDCGAGSDSMWDGVFRVMYNPMVHQLFQQIQSPFLSAEGDERVAGEKDCEVNTAYTMFQRNIYERFFLTSAEEDGSDDSERKVFRFVKYFYHITSLAGARVSSESDPISPSNLSEILASALPSTTFHSLTLLEVQKLLFDSQIVASKEDFPLLHRCYRSVFRVNDVLQLFVPPTTSESTTLSVSPSGSLAKSRTSARENIPNVLVPFHQLLELLFLFAYEKVLAEGQADRGETDFQREVKTPLAIYLVSQETFEEFVSFLHKINIREFERREYEAKKSLPFPTFSERDEGETATTEEVPILENNEKRVAETIPETRAPPSEEVVTLENEDDRRKRETLRAFESFLIERLSPKLPLGFITMLVLLPVPTLRLNLWNLSYLLKTVELTVHQRIASLGEGSVEGGSLIDNLSTATLTGNSESLEGEKRGEISEEVRAEWTTMELLKEFCVFFEISLCTVSEYLMRTYSRYCDLDNLSLSSDQYPTLRMGKRGWDLLFDSLIRSTNVIRILSLNEDLLKYEFSRCHSLFSLDVAHHQTPATGPATTNSSNSLGSISVTSLGSPTTGGYNSYSSSPDFDYLPFFSHLFCQDPSSTVKTAQSQTSNAQDQPEEEMLHAESEKRHQSLWLSREAVSRWYHDLLHSLGDDTFLLSPEDIFFLFDEILDVSGLSSAEYNGGINFSRFVMFFLLAATSSLFLEISHGRPPADTEEDLMGYIEEAMVLRVRKVLGSFAQNLSSLQKSLRLHVLPLLFDPRDSSCLESDHLQRLISSHLLRLFNDRLSAVVRTSLISSQTALAPRTPGTKVNLAPSLSLQDRLVCFPPRPPVMLWDAPRFLEYVRYYNLLSEWRISSLSVLWKVFGMILFQHHVSLFENWQSNEVPPMPLKVADESFVAAIHEKTVSFLQELKEIEKEVVAESNSTLQSSRELLNTTLPFLKQIHHPLFLYTQLFVPSVVAITARLASSSHTSHRSGGEVKQRTGQQRGLSQRKGAGDRSKKKEIILLEDLLRFGGGTALQYYLDHTFTFLSIVFLALQRKAQQTLTYFYTPSLTPSHVSNSERLERLLLQEVPMNAICQFLSCFNILSISEISLLVKESLHNRVRVLYTSKEGVNQQLSATLEGREAIDGHRIGSNPRSKKTIITLNFAEFEELFFRCAFFAWRKYYFLLFAQMVQSVSGTATGNQPHGSQTASYSSSTQTAHPKHRLALETYKREMERVIKPKIDQYLSQHSSDAAPVIDKISWGVNFLKPYSTILQTYSEFPVQDFNYFKQHGGFERVGVNIICDRWLQRQKQILVRRGQEAFRQQSLVPTTTSDHKQDEVIATEAKTKRSKPNITIDTEIAEKRVSAPLLDAIRSDFTHNVASPVMKGQKGLSRSLSRSLSHESQVVRGIDTVKAVTSGLSLFPSSSHPVDDLTSPDNVIHQAKEVLWPVFATYCSCGDASSPGKLSGANLFTLLSKLGILQESILLTDVAIILYQIAQRSSRISSSLMTVKLMSQGMTGSQNEKGVWPSHTPSITFEEFLVFLHEFSKLYYDMEEDFPDYQSTISVPPSGQSPPVDVLRTPPRLPSTRHQHSFTPPLTSASHMSTSEAWISRCLRRLRHSLPFQRLLRESIFPIIEKRALLAFPEDARLRDRFSVIFSLPVLLAVENVEGNLQEFFKKAMKSHFSVGVTQSQSFGLRIHHKSRANEEVSFIMRALKEIHLIPAVMNEAQVLQLVKDVLPEVTAMVSFPSNNSSPSPSPVPPTVSPQGKSVMMAGGAKDGGFLFSQWEYLLCVVACQAVDSAVRQSSTLTDEKKIPSLVADVISSIAAAITSREI